MSQIGWTGYALGREPLGGLRPWGGRRSRFRGARWLERFKLTEFGPILGGTVWGGESIHFLEKASGTDFKMGINAIFTAIYMGIHTQVRTVEN
jgi:hypothetical protein